MNQTIGEGQGWRIFWALTNFRGFDLISGVFIFLVLLCYIRIQKKNFAEVMIDYGVFLFILLVINKGIFTLILKMLHYERHSPSLVLNSALRLSHFVSGISFKDASSNCFPGDHAAVILGSIVYFFSRANSGIGILSIFALVPFVIPRLAVGAHWLTDCIIGATIIVIYTFNVWQNTSLGSRLVVWLERGVPQRFR